MLLQKREWTRNRTEVLREARERASRHEGAYLDFQRQWQRFMGAPRKEKQAQRHNAAPE